MGEQRATSLLKKKGNFGDFVQSCQCQCPGYNAGISMGRPKILSIQFVMDEHKNE